MTLAVFTGPAHGGMMGHLQKAIENRVAVLVQRGNSEAVAREMVDREFAYHLSASRKSLAHFSKQDD